MSPDHGEVGNVGWWRAAECYPCVSRHGRGYLFIGMPGDQDAAYYAGYEIWNQRPHSKGRSMTRTLEDTADERARLANMALADCGLPEVAFANRRTVYIGPGVPRMMGHKATRLAVMHDEGIGALVWCDGCLDARLWDDCERIPVADALRGMTCGKHGGTA